MDTRSQPYNIYTYRPDYFSFTTDRGVEYECNFYSAAEYFVEYPDIASNVFLFNVSRISKEVIKGIDYRIQFTVVEIVAQFLTSKVNAVVYVCDTSDGRDAARFKKFKSWYFYAEHPSHTIIQLTNEVEAGGMNFRMSMLVHKDNPYKGRFVKAYFELTDKKP